MLRLRIPGRIPIDQVFVAILVGTVSGYYIWKEPLRQYFKDVENNQVENVNILPQNNPTNLQSELEFLQKPKRKVLILVTVPVLIVVSYLATRMLNFNTVGDRKRQKAANHADFLYDEFKQQLEEQKEIPISKHQYVPDLSHFSNHR